ncbi:MAG TPA: ParB/Srx family N-terminal domain-containing protein [Stellaceae bacterium]|nr:ParB/Srx family N-terminal domain-containing protein [Stellaceae bacterium]
MPNPQTAAPRSGQRSPDRALAIVYRPIATLQPDPDNPRSHSRKQIRQLADSIASFGLNAPILVDGALRVLAGHGRLLACKELGWTEVPTIGLDHLSKAAARAFMIADNRIAETAAWDGRALALRLGELSLAPLDFDIAAIGFTPGEIALRIETGAGRRARRAAPVARRGDVWLLGRHRVSCGDSGAVADEMLLGADRLVVVASDPTAADAIIGRWQRLTGDRARHAESGRPFDRG